MTYDRHSQHLCPRDCSRVFPAGFYFGGKDGTGDGAPEGLPLICRFSPGGNRRDWLHLAMENPYPRHPTYQNEIKRVGSCAVSPNVIWWDTSFFDI